MVSPVTHPQLWAGHNSNAISEDELNGAGTNDPIWPDLFDALIPLTPIIVTDEMMAWFEGCPDWIAVCEDVTVEIPALVNYAYPGNGWNPHVIPGAPPVITLQPTARVYTVPANDWFYEIPKDGTMRG